MKTVKQRIKGLAFHSNHKPRGWVRALLFDKERRPKGPLRFLVTDKEGNPKSAFAPWMARAYKKRSSQQLEAWFTQRDALIESGELGQVKTLAILASPHTLFIARLLKSCLSETRLTVNVLEQYCEDSADLYVVIAPQYHNTLPPREKTVAFQVEQSTTDRWFTDEYLDELQETLAVIDYSIRNLSVLRQRSLELKTLYFVPLAPIPTPEASALGDRDIDVLFYGDASFGRRQKYIERLRQSFKVEVVTNAFGDEVLKKIRRAKVVVNIHAYETALLETTRICECLSEGTRVVSETAVDQEHHGALASMVSFVPQGDVEGMVQAVDAALADDRSLTVDPAIYRQTKFMVLRMLLGIGVLSPEEFERLTAWYELPSDKLVLSMPEETDRYAWCQESKLDGYELFPGLRRNPSWKGCGLSYWYMARKALAASVEQLQIYEDDCYFPEDFSAKKLKVDRYLEENAGTWDVFSGLISDLAPAAKIQKVETRDGVTYVQLDQLVGLVFGYYREAALKAMAEWDWAVLDKRTGAIDRYLEQKRDLRTLTTSPYLCGHSPNFSSSIWNAHNADVESKIANSVRRLDRMVEAHQKKEVAAS